MICFQMPRGPATVSVLTLTAPQTIALPTCWVQYLDRATAARKAARRAAKKAYSAIHAKKMNRARMYKLMEEAAKQLRKESEHAATIRCKL